VRTISSMRRTVALIAIGTMAWSPAARGADPGSVDATPSPAAPRADQIQFAANEHDLGYRAFIEKRYEEAATHFENAFFAAPNAAELRSAIRARREAGDLARAATLAAIGERRFPGDTVTEKLADEVISQARPQVYELRVRSASACSAAVDERVVTDERLKEFRFFVSPGRHELLVSGPDDRSERVSIDATPGASQTLTFQSAPAPALAPAPAPVQPALTKPFGRAVFLAGAAATTVGVGLTLWSGIDALNSPGQDAVRHACAGVGPGCQEYRQGLAAQLRTNVLLAATGGVAVATAVVGVFFTQWSHPAQPKTGAVQVMTVVGPGQAALLGSF